MSSAPRHLSVQQLQKNSMVPGSAKASPLVWHDKAITKRCTPNEVFIQAPLQHPNIVPVLQTHPLRQEHDIPIAWGGDLMIVLLRSNVFHFNAAKHAGGIGRQIGMALQYLHAQQVFHLDLKLDNVFLPSGRYNADCKDPPHVWLGDFGSSCFGTRHHTCTRRRLGFLGTPQNAPPEFYKNRTTLPDSPKAYQAFDVWCFGVVLFNMWTCMGLMSQANLNKWRRMTLPSIQRQLDAVLARSNCNDMPKPYKTVIEKCLRADWKERPSIRGVLNYLHTFPLPSKLARRVITLPLELYIQTVQRTLPLVKYAKYEQDKLMKLFRATSLRHKPKGTNTA